MIDWVLYALAAVLAIGTLVAVHEFGHFVVAKFFGVGVPVFSLGFGPTLLSYKLHGTEYRLAAFPLGGYVKMAGADPFGDLEDDELVDPAEDFGKKPVWQRLLVLLAGPAANLIFPVVLITVALMTGEPNRDTTLGQVVAGSVAERLGFQPGDRVLAVDDQRVQLWRDLDMALSGAVSSDATVRFERDGVAREARIPAGQVTLLTAGAADTEALGFLWHEVSNHIAVPDVSSPAARAGLRTDDVIVAVDNQPVDTWIQVAHALSGSGPAQVHLKRYVDAKRSATDDLVVTMERGVFDAHAHDPFAAFGGVVPLTVIAGQVMPGSPADAAGLLPGDRVFSVDGAVVHDFMELMALITAAVGPVADAETQPRALDIVVIREGQERALPIVPKMYADMKVVSQVWRPIIGTSQRPLAVQTGGTTYVRYGFPQALRSSVEQTVLSVRQTLHALLNLITYELPPEKGVGGVVAMSEMAAKAASMGIFPYLRFIGMLSINLGVFNLLPVPVLDGGQIAIFSIEAVRGRPVSAILRERLQMVGVLILVAVMIFATVNDTNGLITRLAGG